MIRAALTATLIGVSPLVVPGDAPAQTRISVDAGLIFGGPRPVQTPGFVVQASLDHPYAPRADWRLDAFVGQFGVDLPPAEPIGIGVGAAPDPTVGLAGLSANEILSVTPPTSRTKVYVLIGAETDYLYLHASAVRIGGSAGLGITLPAEGWPRGLVLEMRYHRLLAAPYAPTWFVPLTVRVPF
jgi:hypothetical protein